MSTSFVHTLVSLSHPLAQLQRLYRQRKMARWSMMKTQNGWSDDRRLGERLQVENAPAIVIRALLGLAMKFACAVAIMTLVLTPAHAVEPFGAATTPSQSAGLITLWLDLQTELARDEVEIAHCRIDANCGSAAAQRFIEIIDEARRYGGRTMIGHLNRGINGAIQSTRAIVPWLPPLAALSQPGDCKSYAIVKYLALGELGIAASDRRLVMLRGVSRPNEIHLVVLVRDNDSWIILDNRTLTLVDSIAANQYEPLIEFDANGVRDFRPRMEGG
jgi:predicted transglutaminase-like cysteine proteinase